jgi:ribosomal protein S18 acetylase RimI-like enzyme
VFADNHRAQAFYRKAGFGREGTSKQITIEAITLTEVRFRRPQAEPTD